MDYFQMSPTLAKTCCFEFDKAIKKCYKKEYLRLPTAEDLKAICKLHKAIHKVDGLFGSLDCLHTYWKNCPKAWQGSFKGKEDRPSIVMEAISDYHLFFWQISYGYAGVLNDKNILSVSPFLERLLDGSFENTEKEAGVTPFTISDEEFNKCFILVDGIYPQYSRFVRGVKEPLTQAEKRFTAWQEAVRKDIERAFGVLKSKFQFLERPIHLHNLADVAARVITCIILHNICVADRVMDYNYRVRYDPSATVEEDFTPVQAPADLLEVQRRADKRRGDKRRGPAPAPDGRVAATDGGAAAPAPDGRVAAIPGAYSPARVGARNAPPSIQTLLVRKKERFKELDDGAEHARLHNALMNTFNK
jgi:hypothetical protein